MPSRILVTGGAGFIGRHLSKHLLKQGHSVICLDNLSAPHARFPSPHPQLHCIQDSFENPECLAHLPAIGVLIHLAGKTGVRQSVENPQSFFDSNVIALDPLLSWAQSHTSLQLLMFASSSSVYGHGFAPCREDQGLNPLSPYAQSKAEAEQKIQTSKLPHVILRFFSVYGPEQRSDMAFHHFGHCLLNNQKFQVFNPQSSRDYTHIDDILQGLTKAMDWGLNQPELNSEVFNLGSGKPVSLEQVIDVFTKELQQEPRTHLCMQSDFEAKKTWADLEKSKAKLGYNPNISFQEGIHSFCKWLLEVREP